MIYLASSSPRRCAILRKAGIRFKALRPVYHEKRTRGVSPAALTQGHALGKALSAVSRVKDGIVLGADTVVVHGKKVLGKPRSMGHAETMLRSLQGRTHTVVTGVALLEVRAGRIRRRRLFAASSAVRLEKMDRRFRRAYLRRIRPLDKAGAYAVQSSPDIVAGIRGSRANVAGLPVEKLKKALHMLR